MSRRGTDLERRQHRERREIVDVDGVDFEERRGATRDRRAPWEFLGPEDLQEPAEEGPKGCACETCAQRREILGRVARRMREDMRALDLEPDDDTAGEAALIGLVCHVLAELRMQTEIQLATYHDARDARNS